jgi:hypothetical protein
VRRWLLFIALLLLTPPLGASAMPRLEVSSSPRLAGEAARLRWLPPSQLSPVPEMIGLEDAGPPIRIVLAGEDEEVARSAPPWVAGFAVPEDDLAVLFPSRVPRYPDENLLVLLRHEVAHVLTARATGGRPVPRWFSEGLALVASRGFAMAERSRLLMGGMSGVPASTAELEEAFGGGSYDRSTAYALAGALVHQLVQQQGVDAPGAVLREVGTGSSFPEAFAVVAGQPLPAFEASFWRRWRVWYRWLPFLTSGAALWIGVTALFLLAAARRRARDAAVRRRWQDEEDREQRLRLELAALEDARADERADPDNRRNWIH